MLVHPLSIIGAGRWAYAGALRRVWMCAAHAQLAVQVAVVFAKVARSDYPRQWPGLFSDLLARADGGSTLLVRRVFLVLHHVLKELASKRLAADQKTFAEVGAPLLRLFEDKPATLSFPNT